MEGRLLAKPKSSSLAENAPTGILVAVAKNLARSLDKGLDVEYRAPVLIPDSLIVRARRHTFNSASIVSRLVGSD